jgi:hypothetical protein
LSAAHWGVFRTEGFVVAVSDLATGSNLMEFWFVPGKNLVCSLGGLKKNCPNITQREECNFLRCS